MGSGFQQNDLASLGERLEDEFGTESLQLSPLMIALLFELAAKERTLTAADES